MAPTSPISTSSSCRILTISSSIEHSHRFIQRLVSFATHADQQPQYATTQRNIIPWTISNKYYTADVHFEIIPLTEWSPKRIGDAPAVIFVWEQGTSYQDHIELLSRDLDSHDPDVSLAIKMESQVQQQDDDEGTDEFLSSHGFELIDGNNQRSLRALEDETSLGTPGLARVVDALSTIMWPSMIQSVSNRNRQSRARELLDWAREEESEDGFRALIQTESEQDGGILLRKSRMQKEMDEFQRWLEDEELQHAHQDPWAQRDDPGTLCADSLTPIAHSFQFEQHNGFEDDFSEFMGAPVTPDSSLLEPRKLVPAHTGASYISLGSDTSGNISRSSDKPEDDDDLPTHAEVEATSQRIFGSSIPQSPSDVIPFQNLDDDDEPEFSTFDLSRVFSALQTMKDEISEIGDDAERRKAAARAALGLVYGLQSNGDAESEEEIQR